MSSAPILFILITMTLSRARFYVRHFRLMQFFMKHGHPK